MKQIDSKFCLEFKIALESLLLHPSSLKQVSRGNVYEVEQRKARKYDSLRVGNEFGGRVSFKNGISDAAVRAQLRTQESFVTGVKTWETV